MMLKRDTKVRRDKSGKKGRRAYFLQSRRKRNSLLGLVSESRDKKTFSLGCILGPYGIFSLKH